METEQIFDVTEVKKKLYRDKPDAVIIGVCKFYILYKCILNDDRFVCFKVPMQDIGDFTFTSPSPAQSLIRWIVVPNNDTEESAEG